MCCVPQCTNRAVKDEISLHSFPLDARFKKEWVVNLRIGKPVTTPMKTPKCGRLIEDDWIRLLCHHRTCPSELMTERTCQGYRKQQREMPVPLLDIVTRAS
ncbi:hypothetical protein HPB52_000803 [Rhipicephalus sanguineus]|uniref:THAP-type domain-containing protein n=1 Tax=Rhipicephalus sanguineus TaxID=34632 RepID=A0A9D4PTF7_RHISA|nr:hypothetical protein HPB52_000803 [Rhipicephalus sanguineus]